MVIHDIYNQHSPTSFLKLRSLSFTIMIEIDDEIKKLIKLHFPLYVLRIEREINFSMLLRCLFVYVDAFNNIAHMLIVCVW